MIKWCSLLLISLMSTSLEAMVVPEQKLSPTPLKFLQSVI